MGRALPDPACSIAQAVRRDIFEENRDGWTPVADVQEGDALFFRVRGHPVHLGYAVDARSMLHTETAGIGSALEPFQSMRWKNRFLGAFRYHV